MFIMRKNLKIIMTIVAILLLLNGGLFLPVYITAIQDARTLKSLKVSETEQISYRDSTEMSIVEKLALMKSTFAVELDNGLNMDKETAYSYALMELSKLDTDRLIQFNTDSCTLDEAYASFYIDPTDPEKNMITWNIFAINDTGDRLMLTIDDETGVILGIYIAFSYTDSAVDQGEEKYEKYLTTVDSIITEIEDYYGIKANAEVNIAESKGVYLSYTLLLSDSRQTAKLHLEIYSMGFGLT